MSPRRRSPGDGGLFKRADGMWVGSVEIPTTDGKRRQKRVYSKSRSEARRKLDELDKSIKAGVIPVSSNTTVAKWLAHWLEHIKKPNVRPSTYQFYEEAVRLHIVPKIGAVRLDRLMPHQVRVMLDGVNTSRNAQRSHLALSLALGDAVNDGLLSRNIMDAVAKPGHNKTERGALSVADAKTVIRTAIDLQASSDETTPMLATRWAAGFLTGARPGELRGLEWDRVDLDNGLFDFAWQLQRHKKVHGCLDSAGKPTCGRNDRPSYCPQAKWDLEDGFEYRECYKTLIFTRPKTKAGTRVVRIAPGLLEMLRIHAAEPGPNPFGLVWHHRDGRPLAPHDEHHAWTALLEAAKLPPIEQYATRHTTATLLDKLGHGEDVRMQIMGQSSKVAHRMYLHADQTRTGAALDQLGGLLLPD